jgi:hypothetical protein
MTFEQLYNRLPESKRNSLSNVFQNPMYHPEIWVNLHIEQVFNNVVKMFGENDIDMQVCSLLHDIAKDDTWEYSIVILENELPWLKSTQYNHETNLLDYVDMFKDIYSDLNINWNRVVSVARNHMRTHQYISKQLSNKKKRITFEEHIYFNDMILFHYCDSYHPWKDNKDIPIEILNILK